MLSLGTLASLLEGEKAEASHARAAYRQAAPHMSLSRVACLTAADHRRDEMSAHDLLES